MLAGEEGTGEPVICLHRQDVFINTINVFYVPASSHSLSSNREERWKERGRKGREEGREEGLGGKKGKWEGERDGGKRREEGK